MRLKLSQAIGCQPSYITQVFNSDSHFSLEQGLCCQEILGLSSQEAHFFMLLLQYERAGNHKLKEYFSQQIIKTCEERKFLQSRIEQKTGITKKDQVTYYGSHLNALIHIALTIDELRTPDKIAQRLGIPLQIVRETLEFLTSCNLAKEQDGIFYIGSGRIHLNRESKLVNKHHCNWRIKTLENLDLATSKDFHYSSVLSFGFSDWPKLREVLVSAIAEIQEIIKDSPSEELFVLTSDLFQLKK